MPVLFKKIFLLAFCLAIFVASYGQNAESITDGVISAVKDNSTKHMGRYIDDFVIVSINNAQSVYSHNQALVVLHDFFEKNDPANITAVDSGTPDASSSFTIGSYSTSSGDKYTIYVLMKNKLGKYMIQEIRMNKE